MAILLPFVLGCQNGGAANVDIPTQQAKDIALRTISLGIGGATNVRVCNKRVRIAIEVGGDGQGAGLAWMKLGNADLLHTTGR